MTEGYIKLYRSSLKDPLYMKEPFSKWHAWCDLILLAYYAPTDFFVRNVKQTAKRGCVYLSTRELADRWRWSRGKVERFIAYLIEDGRIKIKESNVVNCITILNYEKFQQNEATNRSTNETTNGHNKRSKEDNNILFPTSQCDMGGMQEILNKLLEEMSDLKSKLDSQDTKTRKKKEPNPLITKGRELFEKKYASLYNADYYWQAKDAAAMEALTKKITFARKQKGVGVTEEEVMSALEALLSSITDAWLIKNFSVTNINSKYNEIVAQAKAKMNNYGTTDKNTKAERAAGAADIIARLAAEEAGDNQ